MDFDKTNVLKKVNSKTSYDYNTTKRQISKEYTKIKEDVKPKVNREKIIEKLKTALDEKNLKENKPEVSNKDIEKAIEAANYKLEPLFVEFDYKMHTKTNYLMVSVINSETKEIIREIPAEKILDALAKAWEFAGIIVDEAL